MSAPEQAVYTTKDGSRTVVTTEGLAAGFRPKETVSLEVTPYYVNIHVSHLGKVAVIQVSKEAASELFNAASTALKQEE